MTEAMLQFFLLLPNPQTSLTISRAHDCIKFCPVICGSFCLVMQWATL